MKRKMRDRDIVKDPVGDPAFYNDQIGENREPIKEIIDKKKNSKSKKGE